MLVAARMNMDMNVLPPQRVPYVVCQYKRIYEQIHEKMHDYYVTAKKMKVLNMTSNLLDGVLEVGSQPIVEVSAHRQHSRPVTGWKTQSRVLRAKGEVRHQTNNICSRCNNTRIYDHSQSAMICDICGDSITVMDVESQPRHRVVNCHADFRKAATYENIIAKEPTPIPAKILDFSKSSTAYKRKNHFRDVITYIQVKSNFKVGQEMIDFVISELIKQRYTKEDFPIIGIAKIEEIVHKYKLTKLYSHVWQIHTEITGIPPPYIEPEHEAEMMRMFDLIQEPFERHRGARSSMLPCQYLAYKFSEMRGWHTYIECNYFRLLKTREKIKQCDRIFEKICEDLAHENFVFIPTDIFTS